MRELHDRSRGMFDVLNYVNDTRSSEKVIRVMRTVGIRQAHQEGCHFGNQYTE